MVTSTSCSSRGPGSQQSVTPGPEDTMPSLAFQAPGVSMIHIHTCMQNLHTHKMKYNQKRHLMSFLGKVTYSIHINMLFTSVCQIHPTPKCVQTQIHVATLF